MGDPRDRANGPGAWPTRLERDDMADTTGAQPPTTGTERTPIALAAGNAHQGAAQAAYAAYVQHRPDCADCRAAVWQCDTAAALWQAFKTARAAAC